MKGTKHITVLVSNDLAFDQRVSKSCETLRALGLSITRVGRLLPDSAPFECADEVVRFKLPFHRGAAFYAWLQVRLFFFLLFKRTDAILANDLDTLLPAFLVSKLKRIPLVYDSHEYFTEAEGLTGRKFQKSIWLGVEKWIFPKLKWVYTVNESIAEIYRQQYHVPVGVVRNVPLLQPQRSNPDLSLVPFLNDKKIVLLQGAYIDPDRGGMEAVLSMQYVQDAVLLVVGSGRDLENMKIKTKELHLEKQVFFLPKQPASVLRSITAASHLGLSLDKPLHLNYTLSLPNKLFDYIHAGLPVVVSNLPELCRIVLQYEVGVVVKEVTPESIASSINEALHSAQYTQWKENCSFASSELNWQKESLHIEKVFREALRF